MRTRKYWQFDEDDQRVTRRKLAGVSYRVKALRVKRQLRRLATY